MAKEYAPDDVVNDDAADPAGDDITAASATDIIGAKVPIETSNQRLRLASVSQIQEGVNISAVGPEWARSPDIPTGSTGRGSAVSFSADRWVATDDASDELVIVAWDPDDPRPTSLAFYIKLDYKPPSNQIGWWLKAFIGDTELPRPLLLPLGGVEHDAADLILYLSDARESAQSSKQPYLEVRWRQRPTGLGDLILTYIVENNGTTIPDDAHLRFYPALLTTEAATSGSMGTIGPAGSPGTAGQPGSSGQPGSNGAVILTESFRTLTQWIRSTTTPTTPSETTIDDNDNYTNFPHTGWSVTIPTGDDPLWIATSTIDKDEDGEWEDSADWIVRAQDSSLIEFYDYVNASWGATASANTSLARIWSNGTWKQFPIATEAKHICSLEPWHMPQYFDIVDIPLADIKGFRADIRHGYWRGSGYASKRQLLTDNDTHLTAVSNRSVWIENQTCLITWNRTGDFSICAVGGSQTTIHQSGGGFRLNFLRHDTEPKLAGIEAFGPYGIAVRGASGYGPYIDLYIET